MAFDPTDNPLDIAYMSLWSQVKASEAVTGLVRPGNMIQYHLQTAITPRKDEISQADLPELILVGNTLKGGLRTGSDFSECTLGLQWIIATGDPAINRSLFPVMFSVYAALVDWPNVAAGLRWRSGFPIKRVDLLESNLGLTVPDQNRAIEGWSAIWSAEVYMMFDTSDVVAFSKGN